MADAGWYARRMVDVIELNLSQCLNRHCTSPVSPSICPWFFLYPISPHFARPARSGAAMVCARLLARSSSSFISVAFPYAIPQLKRMGNWRWGREMGAVGHLFYARSWLRPFSAVFRDERHLAVAPFMRALVVFNALIARVTTPAPMGAFFRNEEGGIAPDLPWMEKGTQGVSLSFKEEVACGSGWFPLYG